MRSRSIESGCLHWCCGVEHRQAVIYIAFIYLRISSSHLLERWSPTFQRSWKHFMCKRSVTAREFHLVSFLQQLWPKILVCLKVGKLRLSWHLLSDYQLSRSLPQLDSSWSSAKQRVMALSIIVPCIPTWPVFISNPFQNTGNGKGDGDSFPVTPLRSCPGIAHWKCHLLVLGGTMVVPSTVSRLKVCVDDRFPPNHS